MAALAMGFAGPGPYFKHACFVPAPTIVGTVVVPCRSGYGLE